MTNTATKAAEDTWAKKAWAKKAWAELVQPLLRRPKRVQFAALCYTCEGAKKQVLLITSRGSGRWILPKGWPIDGLDGAGAAMQEAWEEAGVKIKGIRDQPIGNFNYNKALTGGGVAPVTAQVHVMKVDRLEDQYPEAHERKRKWVSPEQAAEMVREPELKQILRAL
ncbi:MAG: NUDIX hydrolase [Rhodobacterales bacterium]|nr:NUDIX hydrolase [Rhodobacterales bacterium]